MVAADDVEADRGVVVFVIEIVDDVGDLLVVVVDIEVDVFNMVLVDNLEVEGVLVVLLARVIVVAGNLVVAGQGGAVLSVFVVQPNSKKDVKIKFYPRRNINLRLKNYYTHVLTFLIASR